MALATTVIGTNFQAGGGSGGSSVPAQSVCTISVYSSGLDVVVGHPQTYTGTLAVYDGGGVQTVALSSTNAGALLNGPIAFGYCQIGVPQTQTLRFGGGSAESSIDFSTMLGGTDPGDFSLNPTSCEEFSSQCTISATFTPTAAGTRTAKAIESVAAVSDAERHRGWAGAILCHDAEHARLLGELRCQALRIPTVTQMRRAPSRSLTLVTTTFRYSVAPTQCIADERERKQLHRASPTGELHCAGHVQLGPDMGSYTATLVVKDANSTATSPQTNSVGIRGQTSLLVREFFSRVG